MIAALESHEFRIWKAAREPIYAIKFKNIRNIEKLRILRGYHIPNVHCTVYFDEIV